MTHMHTSHTSYKPSAHQPHNSHARAVPCTHAPCSTHWYARTHLQHTLVRTRARCIHMLVRTHAPAAHAGMHARTCSTCWYARTHLQHTLVRTHAPAEHAGTHAREVHTHAGTHARTCSTLVMSAAPPPFLAPLSRIHAFNAPHTRALEHLCTGQVTHARSEVQATHTGGTCHAYRRYRSHMLTVKYRSHIQAAQVTQANSEVQVTQKCGTGRTCPQ